MNHSPRAFTTRLFNHKPFRNMLTVLVIVSLCIALIVTVIEANAPNARIHSLEEGLWWAVTTITGVGYGDFVPVTSLGRIFGAFLEVAGVVIFGLIIGIIGITLSKRQEEYLWFRLFDRLDQLESRLTQHEKQMSGLMDQISHQSRVQQEREREAVMRREQEKRQREMERFREQERLAKEKQQQSRANSFGFPGNDPFADFPPFPQPKPQYTPSFSPPPQPISTRPLSPFPAPKPQELPKQPIQDTTIVPQVTDISPLQQTQKQTQNGNADEEVEKLLQELLKNDKQGPTDQHSNTNQPSW